MTQLKFKQLTFEEHNGFVRVTFLKLYYFDIPNTELEKIAPYEIKKNSIIFDTSKQRAERKFNILLNKGLSSLTNKLSKRKTCYIHKYSGIPLIGSLYFGIVDKGSGMIELKPLTSCNMNCIFCSVDEGLSSKRLSDYIIEKDYLVEETKKILEFKKEGMDIYINPHGEPLLYPEITELCNELSKLRYADSITIITAGTLLTKPMIDSFSETKKVKLNVSLHAVDEALSKKLFGTGAYNLKNVLNMLRYASKKLEIVIAPVLLPNYNEKEIPKIIEFANEINAEILIQKYLMNRMGRNPVNEEPWDSFYAKLKEDESKTGYNFTGNLRELKKTKQLPKPFKLKNIIEAEICLPGRFKGEMLAVSKERLISVPNCDKGIGTKVKLRILKTNYNIYKAELV